MPAKTTRAQRHAERVEAVYKFAAQYIRGHGYAPTHNEIRAAIGGGSTSSVNAALQELIEAGRLRGNERIARGLALPARPRSADTYSGDVYDAMIWLDVQAGAGIESARILKEYLATWNA